MNRVLNTIYICTRLHIFSFNSIISHCMVSALIDCLRRPNTSLPPLNTRSPPPPQMELEGNPALPEPSRGMQTCSLSTTSVPTPAIIDGTNSQVENQYIFVDIGSNNRLGRLDFAEGDIPDGPPDCGAGSLKWVLLLQEGWHFTDDVLGVRLARLQ
jgi:hypothetical protein